MAPPLRTHCPSCDRQFASHANMLRHVTQSSVCVMQSLAIDPIDRSLESLSFQDSRVTRSGARGLLPPPAPIHGSNSPPDHPSMEVEDDDVEEPSHIDSDDEEPNSYDEDSSLDPITPYGLSIDDESDTEYEDLDSDDDDELYGILSDIDDDGLMVADNDKGTNGLLPDISVNTANRKLQYHLSHNPHPKNDLNQLSQIKLLRVLKQYAVPLSTFESVVEWSKDIYLSGYKFTTDGQGTCTRRPMMKKLIKRYNHLDTFPRVEALLLPHCQRRVNMVYHSFTAMLYSLLSHPDLMKDENLLFHNDDPFSPPPEKFTHIADINSGRFYRETYKQMIPAGSNKVLCPLLLYMDETTTDSYGRLSITPLNFTLGIFKRHVRN